MAQRNSGYERVTRDAYETPAWVTTALGELLISRGLLVRGGALVWEPCAGTGKMVRALEALDLMVFASDIEQHKGLNVQGDMLRLPSLIGCSAVITNPPYTKGLVELIIRRALAEMEPMQGVVAMLLKIDFDSAKTRRDIFADHPAFAGKAVLVDRIQWFDEPPEPGKKQSGPSENHAWYIWDWRHAGPPQIAYLSNPEKISRSAAHSASRAVPRRKGAGPA